MGKDSTRPSEKMASPQEEAEEGLNTTSQQSKTHWSTKSAQKLKSKLVSLERCKWLNTTSNAQNFSPFQISPKF
jgi:hypothetical protein